LLSDSSKWRSRKRTIEKYLATQEEIDIVILNKSTDAFWQSESPFVLVECKNCTIKKAGKNEYVAFREKLLHRNGSSIKSRTMDSQTVINNALP